LSRYARLNSELLHYLAALGVLLSCVEPETP
jgi:hypothetical protein